MLIRRAAAARGLLTAAAATALLTTVLLTAALLFAQILPAAGIRAAVHASPADTRTVRLTGAGHAEAGELAAQDATVRTVVRDRFAGVPVDVDVAGYAISQRLPVGFGGGEARADRYAVVVFLDGLADHADLVAGAWPRPVAPEVPAQVALPEALARRLGLAVGAQVPIVDERSVDRRGPRPGPVVISGLWRPRDAADPYWLLAAAPVAGGGYGPMVTDRAEFTARYGLLSTVEWLATPDLDRFTETRLAKVGPAAAGIRRADLTEVGLDESLRVQTGLDALARQMGTAVLVTRSGLLLPTLLIIVIAGYALWLLARLLADQRRAEQALLRARGAARRQLARLATGEALLVVVPAALLGPVLAVAMLRLASRAPAIRALNLAADLASSPQWIWLVSAAAAVGCAAALVLPTARRARTWVAEQQERSRPSRWSVAQRAGADLALVAVAVIAWLQLRQYAGPLTRTTAGLGIDPLLVAAPTIGVLAATAVSLRLLPMATRSGVRLSRRGSFAQLLGMWQADRRPHAGPVLLLVLAVAAAGLATCVAATWQRSQTDQAAHQVGADLRLAEGVGDQPDLTTASLQELPGVRAAMPVHRSHAVVGSTEAVALLGVDATRSADVVRLRSDLSRDGGTDPFARLAAARPAPVGAALPPGTTRLTGEITVELEKIERHQLTPVWMDAFVADARGVVYRLSIGAPDPATGRLAVDVAMPSAAEGQLRLVGLTGGARLVPYYRYDPFTDLDQIGRVQGTAIWRWQLRAVDAAGAPTAVEVPGTWAPQGDADSGFDLAIQPAALVRSQVDAAPFEPLGLDFVMGDPTTGAISPAALVTPDVLVAAGASVGQEILLRGPGGSDLYIKIAGVLDAVPSVTRGGCIVVDLASFAWHQFADRQPLVVPNEWWLATDPRGHAAAVAAVSELGGLRVADRVATERTNSEDPLGGGVLVALYAAALAVTVLAGFGIAVDARATAARRSGELAVLHTLGASPGGLARALVVEQAVLAGLGVLTGLAVGIGVSAAMAPSLILTAAGAPPVPSALLVVPPVREALPAVVLFLVAIGLGALVALRARRDVAAGLLRIGEDQ